LSTTRGKLLRAVESIFPEDDTRVYDAAVESVAAVAARGGQGHIRAVVLLTDGEDTASGQWREPQNAVRELSKQGQRESSGQVRLFTIAYGSEPNEKVLEAFARATGGKAFKAGTDDIEAVYRSISSFF
jgi:Ca-activated chloride channel family protein